jgi:hypothetical protein
LNKISKIIAAELVILHHSTPVLVVFCSGFILSNNLLHNPVKIKLNADPPKAGIYELDIVTDESISNTQNQKKQLVTCNYVWYNFPCDIIGVRINAVSNSIVAMLEPGDVENR